MKTKFEKTEFNPDFDHQEEVFQIFENLGFEREEIRVRTCLTNGCSHYINVDLVVTDPKKIYYDMFTLDGLTYAQIRISDHASNLSRFGQVENSMTLPYFERLLETGAVAPYKG